jgi:hypothetical protein
MWHDQQLREMSAAHEREMRDWQEERRRDDQRRQAIQRRSDRRWQVFCIFLAAALPLLVAFFQSKLLLPRKDDRSPDIVKPASP